ncbi:DUF4190 domain-containing protein [Actinomadura rubrisoli]|uniref:DUF4190 domain-containing protein n=1 Tax=Actinomadura rubrisoli TaxID=2530368 RepID=A0A4V2YXS0_9ACTN|nr:DUF4190 domain-containing protein [Actinomadura rubrisoli]TDD89817.1 DUF4190 domain-containing protein [Actinomadura rubrisoli]
MNTPPDTDPSPEKEPEPGRPEPGRAEPGESGAEEAGAAPGWAFPDAPPPSPPIPGEPPPSQPYAPMGYGEPPGLLPRTNRMAVAALVTGLVGLVPVAVGLGITALVQAGRRNETGKGLAIGGLAASFGWVVVGAVALTLAVGSLFSADRDEAGHIRKSGKVFIATLRVGDCFSGLGEGAGNRLVTAEPCTRPHDGEVMVKFRLEDGPFPGERETSVQAERQCLKRLVYTARSRYAEDLDLYALQPDRRMWRAGEREVTCVLHYSGPNTLTTTIAATVDQTKRTFAELKPHDCLRKWSDRSVAQQIVACTEPHWVEVYAVHNLPEGRYPGRKAVDRKAEAACARLYRKIFKGHRKPQRISHAYPLAADWDLGHRQVACLAESLTESLKRPIVPR